MTHELNFPIFELVTRMAFVNKVNFHFRKYFYQNNFFMLQVRASTPFTSLEAWLQTSHQMKQKIWTTKHNKLNLIGVSGYSKHPLILKILSFLAKYFFGVNGSQPEKPNTK